MAVRNGEAYVEQALRSVLDQTLDDLEVVVVDDASTDGTPDLVRSTRDDRIRLIRNHGHKGLARSLNAAVAVARAPVLARQDADDVSRPNRLRAQLDFLDAHPQIGFIGTAYDLIDSEGTVGATRSVLTSNTRLRWQLLWSNAFCHSSIVVRRDVLPPGPYDADFTAAQDYELWSRLGRTTRCANLPEPLVGVRVHTQSTTALRGELQAELAATVSMRALRQLMPEMDSEQLARARAWFTGLAAVASAEVAGTMLRIFGRFAEDQSLDRQQLTHIEAVLHRRLRRATSRPDRRLLAREQIRLLRLSTITVRRATARLRRAGSEPERSLP